MTGRHGFRNDAEAGGRPLAPFRQHIVEQDRIGSAEHQILVRMHVVVVRQHAKVESALVCEEDLVGNGAAERRDRLSAQIREATNARRRRRS